MNRPSIQVGSTDRRLRGCIKFRNQQWRAGAKYSELTSEGPVVGGSSRHCDYAKGAVDERVDRHVPNERLTVNLCKTYKLRISDAIADFGIATQDGGTAMTIDYSYTFNLMGRLMKKQTDKQMRKGMEGLANDLKQASESLVRQRA